MALKVQASFAAGELDPALQERTNLEKYKSGLNVGRGVVVSKTGRIISKPGRKVFVQTKLANRRCLIWTIPESHSFIEWGHQYVRVYYNLDDPSTGAMADIAHALTESDLDLIHFVNDSANSNVYIFHGGTTPLILSVATGAAGFYTGTTYPLGPFTIPPAPTIVSDTVTGTGYNVEYAITSVINGEESLVLEDSTSTPKLPINAGESNIIIAQLGLTSQNITEMRVYRRPKSAGAYGYIGSSSAFTASGANRRATFNDIGQAADYTHSPPTTNITLNVRGVTGIAALAPNTGTIYQQRLVVASRENIEASRTGFKNNFYRDYPLAADSSLSFKVGTGAASVYRLIDNDGLIAFTSRGVFVNTGALTPQNLAMDKKGNWIIDYKVPPLAIPGGVLFVDASTNTIRRLAPSTESQGYVGEELSIFSNHMFTSKTVSSWAFQEGDPHILWVVFNDGTYAAFTYEPTHEMRAWTRCDSPDEDINIEYVASTTKGFNYGGVAVGPKVLFLVEKNGTRYIEVGIDRYIPATEFASNPEADMGEWIAAMDSVKSYAPLVNDSLAGTDVLLLTPLTADDWEGDLTLTCGTSAIFTLAGLGRGNVFHTFRYFNPDDGSSVDLEVVDRASNNSVTVRPSCEFPSENASGFRLYDTATVFTGLSHLEGESVSVVVDGYVVGSPYNDEQDYPECIVSGGSLTLPSGLSGAIVHIGRPFISDIETLDIDTVEQRPTLIESKTVNKVYVKTYNSRGIYIANKLPADNLVTDMQDLNTISVDYTEDDPIIGNRYDRPITRRHEVTLPGDWSSNGRICLRNVDPIHFEILSIIPDVEDERR